MELKNIHTIYFIGIGGIGMSALARYFKRQGADVFGYDRTASALTSALQDEGMFVHYDDNPALIPANVDLAVYTPAVPDDLAELRHFRAGSIPLVKRAEVLGIISRSKHSIAVGGTHGKTSTSSMTAHLLRACGVDATAFVGGLAPNLGNSNYAEGSSDWVVAEADEYDRSFLHLHPDVAVINAIDADHLDIYGSAEAVRDSYTQFAKQVKPGGKLLLKYGLELAEDLPAVRFGIDHGDCRASNLRIESGYTVFDLTLDGAMPAMHFEGLKLPFPGRHNVENACAAIAAALIGGADPARIPAALADFKGVKRRFEYILRNENTVYIDDYAHHPAELEAVIGAARSLYPGKTLSAVFQPHLYSRTRDFAEGFAEALDKVDVLYLLDIYPARELPIEGINVYTITNTMHKAKVHYCSMDNVVDLIRQEKPHLLLSLGAGSIDTLVEPIKNALEHRD
ncbi:MAG: UDP-N-acetylmuramate--L-alanine ligase [Saprospiraceae bacterium]|nr:UDP-N-acetylmuramate--L-alanine ligase [Saprospiraceae bacterium]